MGGPRKNLRKPLSGDELDLVDVGPGSKTTLPGRYPIRLGTVDELRIELGRVYRDARTGRIPTEEATRLGYLLDLVRKMIETDVIAKRIEAIEQRAQAPALAVAEAGDAPDLVRPVTVG